MVSIPFLFFLLCSPAGVLLRKRALIVAKRRWCPTQWQTACGRQCTPCRDHSGSDPDVPRHTSRAQSDAAAASQNKARREVQTHPRKANECGLKVSQAERLVVLTRSRQLHHKRLHVQRSLRMKPHPADHWTWCTHKTAMCKARGGWGAVPCLWPWPWGCT